MRMRHATIIGAAPGVVTVAMDGTIVSNVPVIGGATLAVDATATLLQDGPLLVCVGANAPRGGAT